MRSGHTGLTYFCPDVAIPHNGWNQIINGNMGFFPSMFFIFSARNENEIKLSPTFGFKHNIHLLFIGCFVYYTLQKGNAVN